MEPNEVKPELALNAYLAQFNMLREESFTRIQSQNQAFNNLLLIMGASITGLISGLNSKDTTLIYSLVLGIALFLPVLTAPLGFIFFDNEIVLYAIGSFIQNDWWSKVRELVNETKVIGNAWDFKYLHKSTRATHTMISTGRWLLFLIPTVLPVLSLIVFTVINWGWWDILLPVKSKSSNLIFIFCITVFIIDILVTWILLKAIFWNFRKHIFRIKPIK